MRLLILGGRGDTTNAVINALRNEYQNIEVVLEEDVAKSTLIRRRIKKLGLLTAIGQICFMLIVPKRLKKKSKNRIASIINSFGLDVRDTYKDYLTVHNVHSINDDESIKLIREYKPEIVVVNGTRIISEKVLNSVDVPFINMHLGITPKYRGVHGGYWAMASNDRENCGVTVHLIDKGIDTGGIIEQGRIEPTVEDNYSTYPYIQVGVGIELEKKVLSSYGKIKKILTWNNELPSCLWSHPTLLQYLRNRKYSR